MTPKPSLTPKALDRLADEELMTLVERRDAEAFAVLYDRHGTAAYSLAHRIVGDSQVAEDVTQEAFLSLWRSKARFDAARGSVRSWTLGIVRNRAIDALRRSAGTTPKLNLDDDALLEAQPSPTLTDSEAIRRDTARRVRGALRGLPPDQVYEVWVERAGAMEPSTLFALKRDGSGAAAVPGSLADADRVLVTAEPRGGSQRPTNPPVLAAPLQ